MINSEHHFLTRCLPDQVVQVLVEHPLQIALNLLQGHDDSRPCPEIEQISRLS